MVIKNNGEREEFDVNKLRKIITPALEGTNISSVEFESLLNFNQKKNIKTRDIQNILVNTAMQNISVDTPDWDIIAGRLEAHALEMSVHKNTKFKNGEFLNHINYLIRNGYYRTGIVEQYTEDELKEIEEYIKPERDYNLKLQQISILKSKYLIKNKKGFIEYISVSDMFTSMILGQGDVKLVKEIYDAISKYVISLATPFKANLRLKNGNTGSCFVGECGDDINAIFKMYNDMAIISKLGGGIGWYLGRLRPGFTYTQNIPKSNIITKWVKLISDISVAVNQRGIRKGAITPALDWYHLDIIEFIESKSELGGGDLRDKCFDIFPQVIVDTFFVDAVLNDEDVYLFNQYDFKKSTGIDICDLIGEERYEAHQLARSMCRDGKLKHNKLFKAKALWKKFLETWIEYGDFYISHRDNINISNYLSKFATAKCVNLCTESFSFSKPATKWVSTNTETLETDGMTHSCNLVSINVANIKNLDAELEKACNLSVKILDASITLGTMPVLEAKKSAEAIRNVGIGVVGVADIMAKNKLMYDTDEGVKFGESLFEKIAFYSYNASIELAKELGAYPLFKDADYSRMFGKTPKELNNDSLNNFDWVELNNNIKRYGIRNFLLLSPAPNTSSALCQGVTASFLPAQKKFFTQKLGDLVVPILPKYIKERYWGYKTKFQYDAADLIKFSKACQKWVDTGISMEVPINPELTNIKKISDEILTGFKDKSLKAVYYSLTVDLRKKSDTQKDSVCEDCAN